MPEEQEVSGPRGRSRNAKPKPVTPKPMPAKPKRKADTPTLTEDLTGKFLRVGNKLYRTSDEAKPIVRLEPDMLRTSNIDTLPDMLRIAKANCWTSIRVNGGDTFKKAAYLAAAAQGLAVENTHRQRSSKQRLSGCKDGSPNARNAATKRSPVRQNRKPGMS